jgi:ABC-type uncharacterized transport system fused permease/ATPase subunit
VAALFTGDVTERTELDRRFESIITNWYALLSRQRWLNVVATAFNGIATPPIAGFAHSDETDIYVIPGRAGFSSARSKTSGQLD